MEILLCLDNNYTMPTGVLMTSLSMNNNDVSYHIIVNKSFSDENRVLLELLANQYGNRISFYSVDCKSETVFPMRNDGMPNYISVITYYRLLATDILPDSIHKIIYLDGDMIVRQSLSQLWNEPIEEYAVGVVHDMDERLHITRNSLPYPIDTGYFNAGMLLINLDYWREHSCKDRFLQFMLDHSDKIIAHDQDVLNSVLFDEKKWLPISYNFQNGFLYDIPEMINYSDSIVDDIHKFERNPAIIHYCSGSKPWHFDCVHPQRKVWDYYRKHSLWKDIDLSKELTIRETLSLFLRKNNFWILQHKRGSIHRNIYRRVILRK